MSNIFFVETHIFSKSGRLYYFTADFLLMMNCGSSSIKYKLFDMDRKEVIAQGGIEKIWFEGLFPEVHLAQWREESS